MVVVERAGADQTVDNPLDLRQAHDSTDRRIGPQFGERGASAASRDPGFHLGARGAIDLVGHQFVEAQRAVGDKLR